MRTKAQVIAKWRSQGLILTSKEEGFEIYNRYMNSNHCEKCGNEYKSKRDRNMDHSHDLNDKYGYFRNVLCQSCNAKRCKLSKNNTSGYSNIYKKHRNNKQGFKWEFYVRLNGKHTYIKSSINKDYLIEYAEQWKKDNHYND